MKLDGKVKGGLAWAGLVVILAVPAADMMFGKSGGNTAATAVTADASATATGTKAPALKPAVATDPIQTASVQEAPAVDKFLKSGKKLPSYISDADEVQPVATTAPTTKAPATKPPVGVTAPTAVAAAPAETPPVPLPRSARPQTTQVASLPAEEKPLIIDEPTVKQPPQQAAVDPFPMSDQGDVVTGDQLEEWDSGSLAEYLERKGLMSEASQSSGNVDEDIIYLDEEPRGPVRRNLDFFLF
ncbi:hypothetical protein [Devosia sp. CN2-171]|jgi:hypothetical protein|uniref:hypothetical protein n=1 Tax=Devosia sp. CN2-171 TaxID=3400909 RepID=UPI003BF77AB9